MSTIRVHDKNFAEYLASNVIQDRVTALATQLNKDYAGKKPLFLAILNGSFMFASDLFKQIRVEAEISFIKIASYQGMRSTGQVVTSIGMEQDLHGRDLVVVEDIVDTGKTLHHFLPTLQQQQPSSIRVATFLHKPDATTFPVPLDYVGFTIPNKFVVGYGLDYDGRGRNYGALYQLVEA